MQMNKPSTSRFSSFLSPQHSQLPYLMLVLFLTFLLTMFNLFVVFGQWILEYLRVYVHIPYKDLLINTDFLLLSFLLMFLYRRWQEEISRGRINEETLLSLQKAVENMQTGVTITAPEGIILYANRAEAEMHGYEVSELIGKAVRLLAPPETWRSRDQPLMSKFERETTNIRKDGSAFPVLLKSAFVTNPEGNVIAIVTTSDDITERKRNEETIRKMAFHDQLTGLPNRALFNDRLMNELGHARRQHNVLAVMFIDLDRFKIINDTKGHTVGDLLLRAVAERLRKTVREVDTVSRLSGDEFVLLFPDVKSKDNIAAIARKILDRLSSVFTVDGRDLYVSASIGISLFPEHADDGEGLLKKADMSMYYAKSQGRNNYQFFNPFIDADAIRTVRIQGDIRRAITELEFVVYYQPQVNLKTGKIVGAEALVRWQHPEFGLLLPDEFIPLAEDAGVISSIGEFVIHSACAQNKAWHEMGLPRIRVAVNISTYHFVQNDFVKMLRKKLDDVRLEPRFLELEFTESVLLRNAESNVSSIKELARLGVQCTIDDFGIGYSSLNYLKYLPIHRIKIDRAFVNSLAVTRQDQAIPRAIIAMARDLNLKVMAEGVETVEQLEFLRSHCCDEAQGYLFSMPIAAKDFCGLLAEEETFIH